MGLQVVQLFFGRLYFLLFLIQYIFDIVCVLKNLVVIVIFFQKTNLNKKKQKKTKKKTKKKKNLINLGSISLYFAPDNSIHRSKTNTTPSLPSPPPLLSPPVFLSVPPSFPPSFPPWLLSLYVRR